MKAVFVVLALLALSVPVVLLASGPATGAATGKPSGTAASGRSSPGLGYIAAALAVGLGCLGAGLAVGSTASAAVGAVAEKEEMAGKALVFVGLAEGIAIYGLIIAIMILNQL